MLSLIIANAVGLIALCLTVYSFQRKDTRQIFAVHILSSTIWAAHFFFLGAYAGCFINGMNAMKSTLFVTVPDKFRTIAAISYLTIVWYLFFIFIYQTTTDLLPLLTQTAGTLLFFQRHNRYMVARVALVASTGWMVYNIYNISIAGVMTEIFIISSIIIGMMRHEEKPYRLWRFFP